MKPDTTAAATRLTTPADPVDPVSEPFNLTIGDVADHLGVSVDTVRRWRKYGDGPRAYRFGKHLRFRLSEVDAWAQEHRTAS